MIRSINHYPITHKIHNSAFELKSCLKVTISIQNFLNRDFKTQFQFKKYNCVYSICNQMCIRDITLKLKTETL